MTTSKRITLLTSNKKLDSCRKHGYLVRGIQLLPGNKSGYETCPNRGACFATCLDTSGMGVWDSVHQARKRRTQLYFEDGPTFWAQLDDEINKLIDEADTAGLKPGVRLNVLSDLYYPPDFFVRYPLVQFYDYTKDAERARSVLTNPRWPSNYDLTYSWNERSTGQFGSRFLSDGGRIALVSRHRHPQDYLFPCDAPTWMRNHPNQLFVDGDEHDLTFNHPHGSVLLLKPKGKLRSKETKFA